MDKLKKVLAYIGGALGTILVGMLLYLGLKRKEGQPALAAGYDPLRELIDEHFTELGKLKKDRIKTRIQRMQIEQRINKKEIKDFQNAVLSAVQSGDADELAAIRSKYLARYDIHRDAENAARDKNH